MRPRQVVEHGERGLGRRRRARGEARDDVHAAGASAVRESTAERGGLHLLRGALASSRAAWGRGRRHHRRTAEHGSSPDGRGRCPSACTASATTADLATRLRVVGALAGRGELRDDDLVDQRDVGLDVEDLGGQVGRAGLLALRRRRRRRSACHSWSRPLHSGTHDDDATLGAGDGALDEQQAPLDVDRVHGQVLGGLAVGPIRPAICTPLNTRDGVEAPPIEPGLRWLRCAPWEAPTPWKP